MGLLLSEPALEPVLTGIGLVLDSVLVLADGISLVVVPVDRISLVLVLAAGTADGIGLVLVLSSLIVLCSDTVVVPVVALNRFSRFL